jgi:uncharacterized protein (DUF4415 family)
MRKSYDFSKLRRAEPKYTKHLKRPLTIRLDSAVIGHFKELGLKTGLPYQSLIGFVLREYAALGLAPTGSWPQKLTKSRAA